MVSYATPGFEIFLSQTVGMSGSNFCGGEVLAFKNRPLETTIERIEDATDLSELWQAVTEFSDSYGFNHVSYHALNIPSLGIQHNISLSTVPADFRKHYLSEHYYEVDPVIVAGASRLVPFYWSDLDQSAPIAQRIRQECREAGIGRNVISAPIHGATGDSILFSLSSDMKERDWTLLKHGYMRDVQTVALYVHERYLALADRKSASDFGRLSPRESECLKWAARGKTIRDTAEILSLSDRVVRDYLDSARSKLDCLTKTQAVVRALLLGMISL